MATGKVCAAKRYDSQEPGKLKMGDQQEKTYIVSRLVKNGGKTKSSCTEQCNCMALLQVWLKGWCAVFRPEDE